MTISPFCLIFWCQDPDINVRFLGLFRVVGTHFFATLRPLPLQVRFLLLLHVI